MFYILPDFNDPNMHGAIYKVMAMGLHSQYSNQGSALDHVYCNISLNGIIVEVCDTHYSDHDTVLVSIPITGESEFSSTCMSAGESNGYITKSNNELVVNPSTSSSSKPESLQ